jgi:hypothetical protein
MHDPEKSDSGIVATKPTNKAGRPVAEPAEPRPVSVAERSAPCSTSQRASASGHSSNASAVCLA